MAWGAMNRLYKAHEFADLTGVTVRALHHYDRVGLLKPQRSTSGYRLYSLGDLERLEQITALKFLGIPLKEIKILLEAGPLTLSESLRLQRRALTSKRDLMSRAIHAIEVAEKLVRPDQATDASVLRKIIEVIEMQPKEDFMRKYYTEEAWAKRSQLREQTPPQTLESHKQAWQQLFLEIEAVLDLDPASETPQLLAKRWVLLAEVVSGGDSGIKAGGIKAWIDHQNWPLTEQDALFARYGLDPRSDRNASMLRVEKVVKYIGQAVARKYGALDLMRHSLIKKSPADHSSERWVNLFRDVESSLAEDPSGEKAQALAVRWTDLMRDTEAEAGRTVPRLDNFPAVFRDASVAVANQVARLYRIEQVSNFLAKALASGKDKRNSA